MAEMQRLASVRILSTSSAWRLGSVQLAQSREYNANIYVVQYVSRKSPQSSNIESASSLPHRARIGYIPFYLSILSLNG
jgi:hypothetical protein